MDNAIGKEVIFLVEIYVSLEEAAGLEGVTEHAMAARVQRGDFRVRKEPGGEDGGRERVTVAVSSLSDGGRRAYRERMAAGGSSDAGCDANGGRPWYVDCDVNWYREMYPDYYYKAVKTVKDIEYYFKRESSPGVFHGSGYTREFAESIGISASKFYRLLSHYTQAVAWGERIRRENENFEYFKILALCRPPKKKTGRAALNDEMKALIENIWFDPLFAANMCKYEKLFRMFRERGAEKGWDKDEMPSDSTIRRYLDDIADETENARYLLAKGEREFKRNRMVKAFRDCRMLKVMELVVADTHTFDCFVTVTDRNGAVRIVKPCLVGFMDMRSRALVGWGVCEVPDSGVIKDVLVSMIMEKENNPFYGVPRVLLIDNGKDYTSVYLTGRSRRERKCKVCVSDETVGLCASVGTALDMPGGMYLALGIERDMRSTPYQAWSKGQVERYFGTVCEDFAKDFESYVGTLTGSLTSGKVVKNVRGLHRKGLLLDIKEFAARFEHWNLEVYSKRVHRGLKAQKEEWVTPLEVYMNAERYFKAAPPGRFIKEAALVKTVRVVCQTGIRLFDCWYTAEALNGYIGRGKRVLVGYDPKDVSSVFVYDADSKEFICKAENTRLLNPLAPVGDKDLQRHLRNQKRQIAEAKRIIEEKQMSYEDRIDVERIERREKAVVVPGVSGRQRVVGMAAARTSGAMMGGADGAVEEMNPFLEKMALDAFEKLGLLEKTS